MAKAKKSAKAKTTSRKMMRKPARKTTAKAKSLAAMAPPVAAYLTVSNGMGALDYYAKALGAKEMSRSMAEDGKRVMHASIVVNGGVVMLSDDFPEFMGGTGRTPERFGGTPVAIHLGLKKPADVDATAARAAKLGGKVEMQPQDTFWGARFAVVTDPFGHRWMLGSALKK